MVIGLGKIQRVSVRDVWASESQDFTPWLAQNLDHIAEEIGLDLELVATEIAVGPFRVDIVAQIVGTNNLVVIENQFGPSDHDHLGKLLTYAAGQEASYAVWIAEQFRPEHRSAMEWVNSNSVEDVGLFGLCVEALRIGDSPVAVQLTMVVSPDEWAKRLGNATSVVGETARLYAAFWEPVIARIKKTFPGWTNMSMPPKASWMVLPSGKSYPAYSIAFTGDRRLRIELYVDGPTVHAQRHLWDQFVRIRDEVDRDVPGLDWDELDNARASRISLYAPLKDVSVTNEDEWEAYQDWILSNLGRFRDAFQPHIDKLERYMPPEEVEHSGNDRNPGVADA